ncbi:MAG: hypothetical protein R3C59_30975 [Planctomycetaceae bacterium]
MKFHLPQCLHFFPIEVRKKRCFGLQVLNGVRDVLPLFGIEQPEFFRGFKTQRGDRLFEEVKNHSLHTLGGRFDILGRMLVREFVLQILIQPSPGDGRLDVDRIPIVEQPRLEPSPLAAQLLFAFQLGLPLGSRLLFPLPAFALRT